MTTQSLGHEITLLMRSIGFDAPELLSDVSSERAFGDARVVVRISRIFLRVTRDRMQSFVDLTSDVKLENFQSWDDIEVAMGWKTTEEVIAKSDAEELLAVLKRIKMRLHVLERAFSERHFVETMQKIRRAIHDRSEMFESKLREIAKSAKN